MEEDPLVTQRMRDIARTQMCVPYAKAYDKCGGEQVNDLICISCIPYARHYKPRLVFFFCPFFTAAAAYTAERPLFLGSFFPSGIASIILKRNFSIDLQCPPTTKKKVSSTTMH